MTGGLNLDQPLDLLAEQLAGMTAGLAAAAGSADGLRSGFEAILEPVFRELGIAPEPVQGGKSEGAASVFIGRPGALHGRFVIEYAPPGSFTGAALADQAQDRFAARLGGTSERTALSKSSVQEDAGVVFDGSRIFFVRRSGGRLGAVPEPTGFEFTGPHAFDLRSARRLLLHLRGLTRPPLTAKGLAEALGPAGEPARLAMAALSAARHDHRHPRTRWAIEQWRQIYGAVHGEIPNEHEPGAKEIESYYGICAPRRLADHIHCLNTYYALVLKLLSANLTGIRSAALGSTYAAALREAPDVDFWLKLRALEGDEPYSSDGFENDVEDDCFRWYLEEHSRNLEDALRAVAAAISEFEPATAILLPGAARDLLRELYHALIPRSVRHKLGEYYTPDWLADLILDEIEYRGESGAMLADPSCGSGTFLIRAIAIKKRALEQRGASAWESHREITGEIWGFDLNPLAVLAARTNYLFALGDLIWDTGGFQIPVYAADSIHWPKTKSPVNLGLSTDGSFDFVVGNPPWIRWGYLAKDYRDATLDLWKQYGLFSLKGAASRLGGGEKDFSMLFTYCAADHFLKKGGKLGFIITQEVFKSKGAGEGFRRFRLGGKEPLKVLSAHDFTSIQPFEGAVNKTAAIFLTKGRPTTYPVPYFVWSPGKGPDGKAILRPEMDSLTVRSTLTKKRLKASPIGAPTSSWQTTDGDDKDLGALKGTSAYTARLGARIEPYGVYWVEVVKVLTDGQLVVRNKPDRGKRKIENVEERIESDLVFPMIRGADVRRWRAEPKHFIVMPQDPVTAAPFPESRMKQEWPRTLCYLSKFKEVLLTRGSRTVREFAERTEFYAMYGIGEYTVARYKVVWKRMTDDLHAAVVGEFKTPFGRRAVIPADTTSLIAVEHEGEAHYLCALLNSAIVRRYIKSFSSAGRGFGAPGVMRHLAIPAYDPGREIHRSLAEHSRRLHETVLTLGAESVKSLEAEIDRLASQLYGVDS